MKKQLPQHIVNILRFCKDINHFSFFFFYLCPIPPILKKTFILSFKAFSTRDYLVQYKQHIEIGHKNWFHAHSLSLPQSCKLIPSKRTRLQAQWECVDGIILHCQRLWQYCALLIIDLVAGVSFSALGIMFTVLKLMIHSDDTQFLRQWMYNTEAPAKRMLLRVMKMNNLLSMYKGGKVEVKYKLYKE